MMVEYNDDFRSAPPPARSVGHWLRRMIGAACVCALPGLWLAAAGALPEARILGLGFSVMLIGVAGLCFLGRR